MYYMHWMYLPPNSLNLLVRTCFGAFHRCQVLRIGGRLSKLKESYLSFQFYFIYILYDLISKCSTESIVLHITYNLLNLGIKWLSFLWYQPMNNFVWQPIHYSQFFMQYLWEFFSLIINFGWMNKFFHLWILTNSTFMLNFFWVF